MKYHPLSPEIEASARAVVDSAYAVHRNLGPGLIESIYEACLCHELGKRDVRCLTQQGFPIVYDGVPLDAGVRLDMIVNDHLIVELKTVATLLPVHEAQALTYLKITSMRLALLINFNVAIIKDGIRRIIR